MTLKKFIRVHHPFQGIILICTMDIKEILPRLKDSDNGSSINFYDKGRAGIYVLESVEQLWEMLK